MRCDQITSPDIVKFAQEILDRPSVGSASTVQNYVSHLSAVFNLARPMWGFQLDEQSMKDAQTVCSTMGITAKSNKRTPRPTLDELDQLMAYFQRSHLHDPRSLPMHKVLAIAIFSTRRQAEICRITWADYDRAEKQVCVRDMKHPGEKVGNDVWVELPDPCCPIIDAMPKKKAHLPLQFRYDKSPIYRRMPISRNRRPALS